MENKKQPTTGSIFLRTELKILGIAAGLFVVTTVIWLALDTFVLNDVTNPGTVIKLLQKGLFPILQITIPSLLVCFGWIYALIKAVTTNDKNKTN